MMKARPNGPTWAQACAKRCTLAAVLAWAAVIATSSAIASGGSAADPGAAAPWAVTEARPLGADQVPLQAAGWACTQALDLPAVDARLLALCRRAAPADARELQLILLPNGDSATPRVLARLADASKATLRKFTPATACPSPSAAGCLAAVVLVDQRDEGSCYGTQVIAVAAGKPARSLGFIDEWRPADGESQCIGAFAQVAGVGAVARIELPGPLARTSRDGNEQRLRARSITYRVVAGKTTLQRLPAGR